MARAPRRVGKVPHTDEDDKKSDRDVARNEESGEVNRRRSVEQIEPDDLGRDEVN